MTADHAAHAIGEFTKAPFVIEDRELKVVYFKGVLSTLRPSRTLHVTNMDKHMTMRDLETLFRPFSELRTVRPGRSPGTAFVDFPSTEAGTAAMQAYQKRRAFHKKRRPMFQLQYAASTFNTSLLFRPLTGATDVSVSRVIHRPTLSPPNSAIVVQKFDQMVTEDLLWEQFGAFGGIEDVSLSMCSTHLLRD